MDDLALIRSRVRYEPDTGQLYWLPKENSRKGWNERYAGKPICRTLKGYVRVRINGQYYAGHRVAWALYHGSWPDVIDHINGDKNDNRIANLRSVSMVENQRNLRPKSGSLSPRTGVRQTGKRWRAVIGRCGKQEYLGTFDTLEAAVAAREAAEDRLGYHPNHGKIVRPAREIGRTLTERDELTLLRSYARRASIALMGLSGGGSEMFESLAGEFYATPEMCRDRAREKFNNVARIARSVAA
jgi:hypothetical protein